MFPHDDDGVAGLNLDADSLDVVGHNKKHNIVSVCISCSPSPVHQRQVLTEIWNFCVGERAQSTCVCVCRLFFFSETIVE